MTGVTRVAVSPFVATLLDELRDDARRGDLDDLAAEVYDGLGWHPRYPPTADADTKRACLVGAIERLQQLARWGARESEKEAGA